MCWERRVSDFFRFIPPLGGDGGGGDGGDGV